MPRTKTVALILLITITLPFSLLSQAAPDESSDNILLDNFVITSTFGDSRNDHYHTGIDLAATGEDLRALSTSEAIFISGTRKRNIFYGNGNLVILEDSKNRVRYNYSHIMDDTIDRDKRAYSRGEKVGIIGNTGHSTGNHIHFEVEDLESKRLINPISILSYKDTMKPIIEDIYFITKNGEKISILKTKYIPRGGKLFIKCKDQIDNSPFFLAPYYIELIIDSKDIYKITFDYLTKRENSFILSDTNLDFNELYVNSRGFDFFITEYYALPGDISIKAIVKDYAGNRTVFLKPIRILPPGTTETKTR